MMLEGILKLVGQFGLPLVLFVVLAIAYDRKEKKHEADRKAWDEEMRAARAAWDRERRDLLVGWDEERERYWQQSKQDSEAMSRALLEAHKTHASIINAANDMASAFTQEKREIKERELLERQLRDTGAQRPARLPPRGGGE